jgi:anti-anti-sigma factor
MFFLQGDLDLATVPLMEVAIADAVTRGGPITLDLSHLKFIDSTGVRAILSASQRLSSGCIVLHGVTATVQKVFDLTGIDRAENVHVIPCAVTVKIPA